MSLGLQLEKYRTGAGLTFAELADLSGVEIGTINALEKRKSKRSEHGPALARALGLSIEQLLDTDTDYSARIKAHLTKRYAPPQAVEGLKAFDRLAAPWATSSPWPFASITPERFQNSLNHDDVHRIEAYIQAIIDMRESDGKKNVS